MAFNSSGAVQGAATGASAGPWGAAIGGIVGGLFGKSKSRNPGEGMEVGLRHAGVDQNRLQNDPLYYAAAIKFEQAHIERFGQSFNAETSPVWAIQRDIGKTMEDLKSQGWKPPEPVKADVAPQHAFRSQPGTTQANARAATPQIWFDIPPQMLAVFALVIGAVFILFLKRK